MNDKSIFLQSDKSKSVDIRDIDPLEAIKAAAEGIGLVLNDPNPNCKKCYGRGYTARHADTGEPIACGCLFPKYESQREVGDVVRPRNRAERRLANKKAKGEVKHGSN